MNLNQCTIAGHATQPPQVHTLPDGRKLATIRIATNTTWKDREGNTHERTLFINATASAGLADIIQKHVNKGTPVYVAGELCVQVKESEADKPRREFWSIRIDTFRLTDSPPKTR